MSKKNKGAIPAAPKTKQETKSNETKKDSKNVETKVEVIDVNQLRAATQGKPSNGLDANHQVDVLMGLKTYFKDDPSAAEKFGKEPVEKINYLTAIGFATAFVQEAYYGDSNWAATMRSSQLEAIKELAPVIGFTIDSKLLPAPDAEGNVTVPASAVKVNATTKKKIEKEKKVVESKPILDPVKIENEDQLKNSLSFFLSDPGVKRPYDKMVRATEFLRSYQLLQADKSDNKEAATTAVQSKTISDLLEEVRVLVGEVPFSTVGISHFIYSKLTSYKNPIFSFCLLRNASKNKATGTTDVDDNVIAAMTRTLVNWANDPKIEYYNKALERAKAELKAGTKKQDYVDSIQSNVDLCTSYFNAVTSCSTDFADNLLENLKSEDSNISNAAKMTVSMILKSYYPTLSGIDDAGDNKDQLLADIQQRAGIITNLFRDPLSQDIRYSEANLTYKAPEPEKTAATEKN